MYSSILNKPSGSVVDVTDRTEGMENSETYTHFVFFEDDYQRQQYKIRTSNNTKYAPAEIRYKQLIDNGFGYAHFVLFSCSNFGKTCAYLPVACKRRERCRQGIAT
jgi:hypothetical protein